MNIDHANNSFDLDVDFNYDEADQLNTASYLRGGQPIFGSGESYQYDDNGNRNTPSGAAASDLDENNRLSTDGTFQFDYDDEGNRTAKYIDNDGNGQLGPGDTDVTTYQWDHRNRLTGVSEYDTQGGPATLGVSNYYDAFNQWIGQQVVEGSTTTSKQFVYERGQIVLEYEDDQLTHRNLWGLAVDQLLATEVVTSETQSGEIFWPLGDHQGSLRDLADANGNVRTHTTYDSFGNELETASLNANGTVASNAEAVDTIFGYTGRPLDEATGLQNNLHRWYDPKTGRWISQDPIGFAAGDANLYRYVGNGPTSATDPNGLELTISGEPKTVEGMDWHAAGLPLVIEGAKVLYIFAETDWQYEISCDMVFVGGKYWYIRNINIDFNIYVLVDESNIRSANAGHPDARKVTRKGTYGHEQLHVIQMKEWLAKTGVPFLENMHHAAGMRGALGPFSTKAGCDAAFVKRKTVIKTYLKAAKKEFEHGGKLDTGIPIKSIEYRPYKDVPMPANPTPFPGKHPSPQR